MALDIFTPALLNRVVDFSEDPKTPLLDKFFPEIEVSATEKIFFDSKGRDRRLAPFVAPEVEGQLMAKQGFSTDSFQPAYIKDKTIFEAGETLKRRAGEPLAGNLTPAQRLENAVADEVLLKKERLNRRLEVMASEVMRTGKVTVTGKGFETKVVDFGRNANHTIALAPGSQWGDVGVSPWADLKAWMETVALNSGVVITDLTFDGLAYDALSKDADFIAALDNRRAGAGSEVQLLSVPELGLSYKGHVENVNLWVYTGKYVHPETGVETAYIPANTVMGGSIGMEGVRHFGAIKDIKATEGEISNVPGAQAGGLLSREMFIKSWTSDDPSARYLMAQSAPLLVPYKVDGTFGATVK